MGTNFGTVSGGQKIGPLQRSLKVSSTQGPGSACGVQSEQRPRARRFSGESTCSLGCGRWYRHPMGCQIPVLCWGLLGPHLAGESVCQALHLAHKLWILVMGSYLGPERRGKCCKHGMIRARMDRAGLGGAAHSPGQRQRDMPMIGYAATSRLE